MLLFHYVYYTYIVFILLINRYPYKHLITHNVVRVIKSRRLRWAGHVARLEGARSAFKILTGTTYKK